MSDGKPWIESLRKSIDAARCTDDSCITCNAFHMDDLMAAVMPHMESAYKVGRMKATARIGRRYVTKNLELSRKLRLVRSALTDWRESDRMTIEILGDLERILGNEEIASEAEADIRSRTLREAGWVLCSPEWLAAHPGQCGIALRVPGDAGTSHWHPSSTRAGTLLEARKEIATWYVDDPAVQRTRDAMAYRLERKAAGDA